MSKGIGGYVRRSERRVTMAGPELRGPGWLRYSVLPSGAVMCWRLEPPQFGTPLTSLRFEEFALERASPSLPEQP